MASNQTTNYELNQWRATGPVVRTDFNADNAKLDAALAGKASAESVSALQTAPAASRGPLSYVRACLRAKPCVLSEFLLQ